LALDKSGSDRIKLLNKARLSAEKALVINPNEDLGYDLLGRWHREMTETSWFTKTYSNLFVVSTPSASYDAALEQFKKAIEINQNNVSHYVELGKTYVLLEKWELAGESFEKSLLLPVNQKADSKLQREAKHYLQLLQQGHHTELTDIIEE
jgi:tetratricopeptide (TPR) repeat protein